MSTERWRQLDRIFIDAVQRPAEQRARFVEDACRTDATLRAEALALLEAADESSEFMATSALEYLAKTVAATGWSLEPGDRVGAYLVLDRLGAGASGEVWRARDERLGRDVAIKIVLPHASSDSARLRRFAEEARLAGSLNHPNLLTVHDVGEHAGLPMLVTEFLDGQSLRRYLEAGPLPVGKALNVALGISRGLAAAHTRGIVHRDVKPENVFIRSNGDVKILDFGLAKLLPAVGSQLTAERLTIDGWVLGTAGYMAPEQVRGEPADARADLFAVGVITYEMLAGSNPFKRASIVETMHATLTADVPDLAAAGRGIPTAVAKLAMRLLEKSPPARFQSAHDLVWALEQLAEVSVIDRTPSRVATASRRIWWRGLEETGSDANEPSATRRPRRAVPILLGGAVLIAIATGLASWLEARRPTAHTQSAVPHLLLKIEGETAENLRLQVDRFFTPFAVSPDGRRLVFRARGNGRSQLFLRELSGFGISPIPGTEMATTPFFSPDGQSIGFWRAEDRILRKVSLSGGSPIEIAATDVPLIALWTSSNEIVIEGGGQKGELWSIPAGGGTPKAIAVRDRSDGELISLRARVPGSHDLLVASTGADGTWLDVLSRETGKRRRLLRGGSNVLARYTGTGHLVFSDGDALRAVPVNQRFEPVDASTPVLHGIDQGHGHSNVALSDNGTVIYLPADHVREAELVWVDRHGNPTPVPGGRLPFLSVALSPDGREVAGDLAQGTTLQVWVLDLERRAKRLLVSEGDSRWPIWSRDGRFITYWSTAGNSSVFRKRADGTGSAQLLMRGLPPLKLEDWSPDGRSLLFSAYTSRGDTDLWIYSDGKAMPFLSGPSNELSGRFSPDGRFIAFEADDGGVSHVYVQPFPGPGPRTAISADEGYSPAWIDGGRLLFLSPSRMMVVDVQTLPDLRVGQTRPLNERRDVRGKLLIPSPNGRQFLMLSPRSMDGPIELRIILNWFQELERLAPHPR
jgi:serine/threonine protein kinase/Tol biopolymer transport system component